MAKPSASELVPIERLTAQEWQCPFCGVGNGVPEVTVCACGAVRDGNTATAPAQAGATVAPQKPVTTPDEPDDDEA